jgi:membrane protein DedA with SNARE-associated domain
VDAQNENGFGGEKLDNAFVAGLAIVGAGAGAITGYFIGRRGSKRVLAYEAK